MMDYKNEHLFAWICIMIGIAGLDQISKMAASNLLSSTSMSWGIFSLVLSENHGMSFGLGLNMRLGGFVLWLNIFLWGLLAISLPKTITSETSACGVAMMLGGGLGNMIDRMSLGYVVDFLGVGFNGELLILNLADIWIFFGALIAGMDLASSCIGEPESVEEKNQSE